jgi:DNA-binding PadR family transcriptional regulator
MRGFWREDCGPRHQHGAGRNWDWKSEAFFWGGRRGGPWRGGRMFEQGDLKFVILRLLDEKPRHGYDIIKELEARSGGRYAPSPGTVYPTLTLLEDMGYASVAVEDGGKKVFHITEAGKAYLAENQSTVDDVLERLTELGASIFGDHVRPAHEAMTALGKAYLKISLQRTHDQAQIDRVVEILKRATAELEAVGNATK